MILGVWPVSGVHLSAPLDYAPQQGPFQSNQMHINNICKQLYQRIAQPNTCYNILFEKPRACLGHETPMWKQGRTRGIWGAQAIRKNLAILFARQKFR